MLSFMEWKQLKQLRKEKGLNQYELAVKLHVSQPAISGWEKGLNQPSIEDLIALSKLFNVSIDFLLDNKPEDMILITKKEYLLLLQTKQAIETIEKREGNTITFNVNDEGVVNYYEAQNNKGKTK